MLKMYYLQVKKTVISLLLAFAIIFSFAFSPVYVSAFSNTAPNPPTTGAFYSGVYRNVFVESGVASPAQVSTRLNDLWTAFVNYRYKAVGSDMAYIDDGSGYALTEGMSYGMNICLQMNKKTEFDRLWKWAKTYMYMSNGQYKGFFSWKVKSDGAKFDEGPAPDGEEYFATALFMAASRWGNGTGIYNYQAEANAILNAMLHQADDGVGANMVDLLQNQIKFAPYCNFTDPSYHLPAFYDYFAQYADADKDIWHKLALKSRSMWLTFSNSYGLSPNYASYDGKPYTGFGAEGSIYGADAWRTIMNASVDYAWWAADSSAKTYANNLANFYAWKMDQKVPTSGAYYGKLNMDGSTYQAYENPAAYAAHGVSALAADSKSYTNGWKMLQRFWDTSIPTGYYDQLIYHLAFLHCSGNFKIYKPITETYVKLQNRATGLCIDGMGRPSNGSNAGQWSSNSSYNQQWQLISSGSYVKFKNRATGLYLDGYGYTTNGSVCGQWSNSSSYNQQWELITAGSYIYLKNRATGLYIDGMGNTNNGDDLGQYSNSGSNNQQWQIIYP